MVFKVYAGPLGHTYAQLYQYCGSLICIGLGLPPPKLLGSTERTHQAWPKSSEIHQYDQHISTVTNVSPTCHQRVTNVLPTCHQRVTCHLFDWSTICSSRGHTEHWQIRLRDFMQTALMESHLASWRIFKWYQCSKPRLVEYFFGGLYHIIPTIFWGGWSEFHWGNLGEPTNGMIEGSIEHQHWPIHGANQHANWDLSKPWALSHVDRGCVDA